MAAGKLNKKKQDERNVIKCETRRKTQESQAVMHTTNNTKTSTLIHPEDKGDTQVYQYTRRKDSKNVERAKIVGSGIRRQIKKKNKINNTITKRKNNTTINKKTKDTNLTRQYEEKSR